MRCEDIGPIHIYLWLYSPLLDLGRFFSFLILHTVGRTPWTGDQAVARPLPTHRTTQTQNKRTQTSMPWVEFEPTIPAFEDGSCLRPRGHCDRPGLFIRSLYTVCWLYIEFHVNYVWEMRRHLTLLWSLRDFHFALYLQFMWDWKEVYVIYAHRECRIRILWLLHMKLAHPCTIVLICTTF
jgi:hypothetical protein